MPLKPAQIIVTHLTIIVICYSLLKKLKICYTYNDEQAAAKFPNAIYALWLPRSW